MLDIGCGEGLLVRQIHALLSKGRVSTSGVLNVVGIDPDLASIERAKLASAGVVGISYLHADARTYPFPRGSFDAVVAVNALHHFDFVEGLKLARDLVRPGGVVGIINLGRRRHLVDAPWDGVMFLGHVFRILPKNPWDHGAPVKMPDESFAEIRKAVREVLPGAIYRRRFLGRCTIVWIKPVVSFDAAVR